MKNKPTMSAQISKKEDETLKPVIHETDEELRTTGYNLPDSVIHRVKNLAVVRGQKAAGRSSASKVLYDILAEYLDDYERRLNAIPDYERPKK